MQPGTFLLYLKKITKNHIIAALGTTLLVLLSVIFHRDQNVVKVSVHTYEEKSTLYDISLEYPEFENLPRSFNDHIKTTVLDALAKFKFSSEETEVRRKTSAGKGQPSYTYSFTQSFIPEQIGQDMVSIVLKTAYFTGGAHGGEDIFTFTYDKKKGKEVTLPDVFGSAPNYLRRISDYAASDLKEKLRLAGSGDPDMAMLKTGTAPTLENFSKFTLSKELTITFYFPQYQVAAYVFGQQTVTMPLSFILENPQ